MSINKAHQANDLKNYKAYKAAKPDNLAPAPTYGNATTTGLYRGSVMASPRADANDHQAYVSRDSGAQIVRCV